MVSGVAPSWNARMTSSRSTREAPTRREPAASSRMGGISGSKANATLVLSSIVSRAPHQERARFRLCLFVERMSFRGQDLVARPQLGDGNGSDLGAPRGLEGEDLPPQLGHLLVQGC